MQNVMQDILKKIIKAPAHNDKDVRIVEEGEEEQVHQTGNDGDEDDRVDVEDISTNCDHICRPEILYEEEGSHVNDEVERVETDHIVPDRRAGVADGMGDAEDVDIRHVDRPRHILHHLATRCWWLCNL